MSQPSGVAEGDQVGISVPATSVYVGLLRTLATGVGSRLDLPVDQIEDLRLAVGEAAAILLDQAEESGSIRCQVTVLAGELVLRMSTTAKDPQAPSPDSFSWTILSALAPRLQAHVSGEELSVTLAVDRPVLA